LAYFYWILKTNLVLKKEDAPASGMSEFYSIGEQVAKTFILFFTLLPLMALYTPSLIIQITQLLIAVLFLLIIRSKLSKLQINYLIVVTIFYILLIVLNSIVDESWLLRLGCILFNALAVYLAFQMKRSIANTTGGGFLINNKVFYLFMVINSLAVLLNIFGHVSVSRDWSIAGAVGIIQAFTLGSFREMIKNDFKAYFAKLRLKGGYLARFDEAKVLASMDTLLKFICTVLAIIVFANNLHILQQVAQVVGNFLNSTHKIGNIGFNFGDLFVAIIIIMLANWIQKNLNLLLVGNEVSKGKNTARMTLFPLFRLGIILVGFFMAISALGMGLDKLTVVIGALSVGVGLGMQNIINNFVSGIILVFDKPFRVGDVIELADRKGEVKEIGIRSSTLITGDGSEVIIPNGDLLSGRLVNWTMSNPYRLVVLQVHVEKKISLEEATALIKADIKASPYLLQKMPLTVILKNVTRYNYMLTISCWVGSDIGGTLRSDVIARLNETFLAKDIHFYTE